MTPPLATNLPLMTDTQYTAARKRLAEYEKWRNGRTSIKVTEISDAGFDDVTNDVRSQVQVYEFTHRSTEEAGKSYFAYFFTVHGDKENGRIAATKDEHYIGTWMGDLLAKVTYTKQYEASSFGRRSTRVSFRAKGIDGREYSGTAFKSSGDYIHMKARKTK